MNVGEFIYQELERYRVGSNKTTPTPFPQLISLFLKMNNIWYLDGEQERMVRFGKTQIRKMKIPLPLDVPEEPQSKRQRVEPETSKADEAHSSRAASPSPSFFGTSIQLHIQEALKPMVEQLMRSNQQLREDLQNQIQGIIGAVNENFKALYNLQANYLQQICDIRHKLNCLEASMTGSPLTRAPTFVIPPYTDIPSASPSQPPPPTSHPPPEPSNVLCTVQETSTSTPVHITVEPVIQPASSPQPTPQLLSSSSGETQEVSNPDNTAQPESSNQPCPISSPSISAVTPTDIPPTSPSLTIIPSSDQFHTPSEHTLPSTSTPPPAPTRDVPPPSDFSLPLPPNPSDNDKKGENNSSQPSSSK